MKLPIILNDIVSYLPAWENAGLNESQTCQVVILRILHELGYDIWNPFEIFAEKSGGVGSGKYFPDYTVVFDKQDRFVIEAKKLGEPLNTNREQPINYVNSKGLRWAVLTDGKNWEFLDNRKNGAATEKLAITIVINNLYAARYLEKLLSPTVWRLSDAEERIAHSIKLIELTEKIRKIIKKDVDIDENLLNLAVENRQFSDSEHNFAIEYFSDLVQLIVQPTEILPLPPPIANIEKPVVQPVESSRISESTVEFSQLSESKDVLEILRKKLEKISDGSSGHATCKLRINSIELKNKISWSYIYAGIAETCIATNKPIDKNLYGSTTEKLRNSTEPYPKNSYRKLSNGKYLFIRYGAPALIGYINKLLKNSWYSIPKRVLEVEYENKTYYLPE